MKNVYSQAIRQALQLLLTSCFGTDTGTKCIPESRLACAFFFKHRHYFPSSRPFVRTYLRALHPYLDASLHLLEALSIERWVLGCNMEIFYPSFMHLFSWIGEVQLARFANGTMHECARSIDLQSFNFIHWQ